MPVQFAVLSSGSRGNSTLIQGSGPGLLVDFGLMPRELTRRLEEVGSCWNRVGLALLTHTHSDHINKHSLRALAKHGIPLYCHGEHCLALEKLEEFAALSSAGLVRPYKDEPFWTPTGARVEPLRLHHGETPTFGFRIEVRGVETGRWVKFGYIADSGHWSPALAEALTGVDLLGVEFNHDVGMQWRSGRHIALIRRNIGDQGHLSNEQGADLVREVIDRSGQSGPRHIVLLHLSDQCNEPKLAMSAATRAIRGCGRRISVHPTSQRTSTPNLLVRPSRPRRRAAEAVGFPWEEASPSASAPAVEPS